MLPATEADLPFISRTYAHGASRSLVSLVITSRKLWHYYVGDRGPLESFHIVETPGSARLGFPVRDDGLGFGALGVGDYELTPGVGWLAMQSSVLRCLAKTGDECAARDKEDFASILFGLGSQHPCYRSATDLLGPLQGPEAFCIRVSDLPAFLRHIAPVLEERLANSVVPGWSGELKLSFYQEGLRFAFEKGTGSRWPNHGRPRRARSRPASGI